MRGFPKNFGFKGAAVAQSIFTNQEPEVRNGSDGQPYELGLRFKSNINGFITGIRFWKAANETGIHKGRIWFNNTALNLIEFTNETPEGWQQQNLSTNLLIEAEIIYTVSVNINTHYVGSFGEALTSSISNGNLSTIADGNNGVLAFNLNEKPTQTFRNANYFRDIVFVAK